MRISIKKQGKPFVNENAALMAFQTMQMYFAQCLYLTTSALNLSSNRIELTVYFDLPDFPSLPIGYRYSEMEITSHIYFSVYDNKADYVRCVTYYFKY